MPVNGGTGITALKRLSPSCAPSIPEAACRIDPVVSDRCPVRKQTAIFLLDHLVALAGAYLEARAIQNGDTRTPIIDEARTVQFAGRFRYSLPPDAEHICDERVRHAQFIALQPIHALQEPSTELLIHRVMSIAYRGLRHLCN